jgi:hypothetical protein
VIATTERSLPPGRPIAVTLERPRVAPTDSAVRPASFHPDAARPALFRGQGPDPQTLPLVPGGPVTSTVIPRPEVLHAPTPVNEPFPPASVQSAPGGVVVVPGSTSNFAEGSPFHAEVWEGDGYDPMQMGCVDSVGCAFDNRLYLEAEALAWRFREANLPPLGVVGVPGMPPALGGMGPINNIVLGGALGDDLHTGFRVRAGAWLNSDHTIGVEGSYFGLMQDSDSAGFMSTGQTLLGIPYQNAVDGTETALNLAGGGFPGGIQALLESRLWGAEANVRANAWAWENLHIDLLAGYRVLGLDDNLQIDAVAGPRGPGFTGFSLQDRFSTRNRFHGGQVGAALLWCWGRFSVDVAGKLAIGGTHQQSEAGGNFRRNGTWGTGGLFAQPSNMGNFSRNQFSWVPELSLKVGYQVTDCLRAYAGYNFLYWTNVVRPGDQIDRVVNPSQLFGGAVQGPPRPLQPFKGSEFWAQGLSLGLELRY